MEFQVKSRKKDIDQNIIDDLTATIDVYRISHIRVEIGDTLIFETDEADIYYRIDERFLTKTMVTYFVSRNRRAAKREDRRNE